MAEIGTDIQKAKEVLEAGELVSIPTETVYGLAGNALQESAVTKIFEAKKRPHFDPLIIHVPEWQSVHQYATDIPEIAEQMAKEFWPGPLTMILKKKSNIPDLVSAGLDTVGIRSPDHPLTQNLLRSLSFPLAAPSANPFGYVSPTRAAHVNEQLGDRIQYILDGGICKIGIESTIIGFEEGTTVVYRMGGIPLEEITRIAGKVLLKPNASSNPRSPGQLKSHYSPNKKVLLGNIESMLGSYPSNSVGVLSFSKNYKTQYQIRLSPDESLHEAAKNLFAALRAIDKMPVDIILTELVPDTGIGRAINDRLRRASSS